MAFYTLGGFAFVGVLIFLHVSDNAASIGPQQQLFIALNALGLFIASGWYFYSGYRLYKLPPYAVTKQILYVTLTISLLSTFSALRRLSAYHEWRETATIK